MALTKELNAHIARIVEHENKLRAEIDAMIRELEAESLEINKKGGYQ